MVLSVVHDVHLVHLLQGWEKVKSAAKSAVGGNQGVTK